MQLAPAAPLQRQQDERRGEAVADARLDGDARPELADERIEADAFLVAQPPGVVAGRRIDDPPELLVAGLELLDEACLLDLGAVALEHGFATEEALDELARDLLLELRHRGDSSERLAARGGAGGAPSGGRSRAEAAPAGRPR